MRIAIATSKSELPPSDEALRLELTRLGAIATPAIWSCGSVDWGDFNAVLIRSCWDYHLRPDEFLTWIDCLDKRRIAVLNTPSLIRWNANKEYLREFEERGIHIPGTEWIAEGSEADVAQICAARGWSEAVVKPLVSASAHGTERRSAGRVNGPAMVQEYRSAIETVGEWSVVFFAGRFDHAVRKLPRRGDFRVQMEYGGTAEAGEPPAHVLRFATGALACLPLPATFARVDLIADASVPVLMEMEVIEPELFLDLAPGSARRAAYAVMDALAGGRLP